MQKPKKSENLKNLNAKISEIPKNYFPKMQNFHSEKIRKSDSEKTENFKNLSAKKVRKTMKYENKNPKKGNVKIFLSMNLRDSIISVLDTFISADSQNHYSVYAQKIKNKILKYGREITYNGEKSVAIYFYETEAVLLINLFAIYINATEKAD